MTNANGHPPAITAPGAVSCCRACGRSFHDTPLLRYHNMPGAAQHLPDRDSLHMDRGTDLEVCQCTGCGLVQLSNGPVSYYREVIRAAAFSEEMGAFRRSQFAEFTGSYGLGGGKVLEVGCGKGEYLSLMRECGVDVYGLEASDESVGVCALNGFKVDKGFVDQAGYRIGGAPFDGFFMLNFLEHLPDPNATLTGIRNNLADGAVGLVEVPNFDMILRNRLFSEFIGDHLLYFTKETLAVLLRLNGFDIIQCNEVWYDYIISAIVRKRPVLDIGDFHRHQERLKAELHRFIDRFRPGKVAIWGAGHQALAVMALTGLAGRIRYVIDSAAFKQGKFTPATHIPIVSPEALHLDQVDAVIVMAASYSDEVAGILRREFSGGIPVAILRDHRLELVGTDPSWES